MKILDAWIDDPTVSGILEPPTMLVEVDHKPDVTIPEQSFPGGWIVGKSGPFVNYRQKSANPTAGDFNVRFRGEFPVVVDIELCTPDETYRSALPLPRARQLLRKYHPDWSLLISDRDAERGSILWLPVQRNPICRHWMGTDICAAPETRTIKIKGINFPLCRDHLKSHNDSNAAKRTSSK